jgi:hypothetical protein
MVGLHHLVFMERAFGADVNEPAGNLIVRPQSEIDQIIFVLEHWEVGVPLKSIVDPKHFKAVKAFRETHKPAYKWVNLYILENIELPDGSQRKVLHRKEANKPNGGRIVFYHDTVFDAINEWHHKRGHLGQERTLLSEQVLQLYPRIGKNLLQDMLYLYEEEPHCDGNEGIVKANSVQLLSGSFPG